MRTLFLTLLVLLLATGLSTATTVPPIEKDNLAVLVTDMAGPSLTDLVAINYFHVFDLDDPMIHLGGANDRIVYDSRTSWVNTGPADLSDTYYMTTHVGMVLDLNTAAVLNDEDVHTPTSSLAGSTLNLGRTARDWVHEMALTGHDSGT